jgi:hypothetical protein
MAAATLRSKVQQQCEIADFAFTAQSRNPFRLFAEGLRQRDSALLSRSKQYFL